LLEPQDGGAHRGRRHTQRACRLAEIPRLHDTQKYQNTMQAVDGVPPLSTLQLKLIQTRGC
jgi:hypothetical protein